MKKYMIWLLAALVLGACQKEDDLGNEIDFSNPYVITDDADDPVQQERYRLYTEYGVSVYFSDTVGQVYVRDDIYGNPVYRYEVLDPCWTFFNDAGQALTSRLDYKYTEGEERQLKTLEKVRGIMEKMGAALRPRLLLVVDSVFTVNSASSIDTTVAVQNNFKFLLWPDLLTKSEAEINEERLSVERKLVKQYVKKFEAEIAEFGKVSAQNYVVKDWSFSTDATGYLHSAAGRAVYVTFRWGYPEAFLGEGGLSYEELVANNTIYGYMLQTDVPTFVDGSRKAYAAACGPFGFVNGPRGGSYGASAPDNVEEDVGYFVDMMLSVDKEKFEKYWGSYSMVMKKYHILYDVIVNEMGVEL